MYATIVRDTRISVTPGAGLSSIGSEPFSEYLPFGMGDRYRLVFGRDNNFNRELRGFSERVIVYNVISSFIPYHGDITPPWARQIESWPILQPFTLRISGSEHSAAITFMPHSQMGVFARVSLDGERERWFTVDQDAFFQLSGIINAPSIWR